MKLYKIPYGLNVSVEFEIIDSVNIHGQPCKAKRVIIHAPMYQNTKHVTDWTWSDDFSDAAILQDSDFVRNIRKMYSN